MAGKYGFGLLRTAGLKRRQLMLFALISAAINGLVTASVGAWLAQTYAQHQSCRQSIENIANLFYARRTRAGMVVSSLRRNAPAEEITHRKRAYDEAYVDWNTNIRKNLFVIREVMGQATFAKLEQSFEDDVVAALADIDRCLTKSYDEHLGGRDPVAALTACKMADLYQFALDCGATYTNELFKLSRLSFNPLFRAEEERIAAEERVKKGCTRPAALQPASPPPIASPQPAPAVPHAGDQAVTGSLPGAQDTTAPAPPEPSEIKGR